MLVWEAHKVYWKTSHTSPPPLKEEEKKKEESSKDPQSQDRYRSFKEGSDENLLLLKIILRLLDLPLVLAQWSLRVPSRWFRITKARGHPPRPSPFVFRTCDILLLFNDWRLSVDVFVCWLSFLFMFTCVLRDGVIVVMYSLLLLKKTKQKNQNQE